MQEIRRKISGSRVMALLLSIVMMIQLLPITPLAANEKKNLAKIEAENQLANLSKAEGVVISIENSNNDSFILEPTIVEGNKNIQDLIKSTCNNNAIDFVEKEAFGWLKYIRSINSFETDEPSESLQDVNFGNKQWLLVKNNIFDYETYDIVLKDGWKPIEVSNESVIRLIYAVHSDNKVKLDEGGKFNPNGHGTLSVNKDALVKAIALAKRDYPSKVEAINSAKAVALDANASQEIVNKAVVDLHDACAENSKIKALKISGEKEIDLNINESKTFAIEKDPINAEGTVSWSVSDLTKGNIDQNGKLILKSEPGDLQVTARIGLMVSDGVLVHIKAPATNVEITAKSTEVVENQEIDLKAIVTPENSTDKIVWSSSDEKIAKVNSKGEVTGIKKGTATITATAGEKSASIEITVKDIPATDLTIDMSEVTLPIRNSVEITATPTPEKTTEKVHWSIKEGSSLISIEKDWWDNNKCKITANELSGDAVVIAKIGNITKEIPVHIITIPATSIEMDEAISVREGESNSIQIKVNPNNTTDNVKWASANDNIARVDSNGIVTGVNIGTTTITATVGNVKATTNVTVTEKAYLYFKSSDGVEKKIENGTITLTPTDSGSFKIKNFDGEVFFGCDVTPIEDENFPGTYSENYIINSQGNFQPFGNKNYTSQSVYSFAVLNPGEENENIINFTVKLVPSDIKEIRLLADGKVVSEDTFFQQGATQFYLTVQGRANAKEEFRNIPTSAINFWSENQDYATVQSDGLVKPVGGQAKIHADLKCSDVKTWTKVSATAVATEDIKITVPETNYIDMWNGLGGYYVGVMPHTGFQVEYTPSNTTQKQLVWEALTPEIATYMEAFSNGIIPKRAGIARFKVYVRDNPYISKEVFVKFVYKVPLNSVTLKKTSFEIGVGNTIDLNKDLVFNPSNASEQRFDWKYSKDGIVRVDEFVRTDTSGTAYKWFEHQLVGLKSGTVKVTGIPMDTTSGAKPITFTVKVGSGNNPDAHKPVDISNLLNHGLKALKSASHSAYEDEWTIFPLVRAGENISESDRLLYIQSVKNELNSGKDLQPTDHARIVFTLTAMGIDPENFEGINILERMCCRDDFFNKTSNHMIWALIALDTHNYEMPANSGFTRDELVDVILKYQRPDGSFSLSLSDPTGSIDMTAMALQSLAKYEYRSDVKSAIEKALIYLQTKITKDAGFINEGGENSCTAAQVLTALTALEIDPVDPNNGFVRNGKNMISRLEIFKVDVGFALLAGQKTTDLMSMQQITYALESYRRFVNGENSLYDMNDVELENAKIDNQKVANAVIDQIKKIPSKPTKDDFGALYMARQAYDSLSDAQKKLVTNYGKLVEAEKYYEDQKVAKPVINMIDKLDSSSTRKDIESARRAYDALTDSQKAIVTNYDKLVAAEKNIKRVPSRENPQMAKPGTLVEAQIKNGKVSANQLEAIKGQDKLLVIKDKLDNGLEYTLKILGTDVHEPKDFETGIVMDSNFAKEMNRLSEKPLIFSFAHKGKFPGKMLLELPVDLSNGNYFLMKYDSKDKSLIKVSVVTVEDKTALCFVEEGGDYLLAKRVSTKSLNDYAQNTKPSTEETVQADSNNIMTVVIIVAVVVVALVAIYFIIASKKRKYRR